MKHTAVITLFTEEGGLILQQRDMNPAGASFLRGKIAFFGGHVEEGESAQTAIIREAFEELELQITPEHLVSDGIFRIRKDKHGIEERQEVFRYLLPINPSSLVVHEGDGAIVVKNRMQLDTLPFAPFAAQLTLYYLVNDRTVLAYKE